LPLGIHRHGVAVDKITEHDTTEHDHDSERNSVIDYDDARHRACQVGPVARPPPFPHADDAHGSQGLRLPRPGSLLGSSREFSTFVAAFPFYFRLHRRRQEGHENLGDGGDDGSGDERPG
jgi:hypothetical protein